MSNDSPFMVKTKRRSFAMLFMEVIQMDLVQIGKFIAELRKEQELTKQVQWIQSKLLQRQIKILL